MDADDKKAGRRKKEKEYLEKWLGWLQKEKHGPSPLALRRCITCYFLRTCYNTWEATTGSPARTW